jgi:hypothetical protein
MQVGAHTQTCVCIDDIYLYIIFICYMYAHTIFFLRYPPRPTHTHCSIFFLFQSKGQHHFPSNQKRELDKGVPYPLFFSF